ncbi:MAG TPA: flagellar export chaperone FliS [Terriglobales bacterium]|nr:flagellar export chaperone FliS [Terriglobales bacterium]
MNSETLRYRAAAVQSATPIQLACMLYDTLIRDFGRIISAIAEENVEARAGEVKHALLVLQQLEAQLDVSRGGEAAASLSRFYALARGKILRGHATVDPAQFRELIDLFLEVRSAWEKVSDPRTDDNSGSAELRNRSGLSCSA